MRASTIAVFWLLNPSFALAQPVFTINPADAVICNTTVSTFGVAVDFAGGMDTSLQWRFNDQDLNNGDRDGRVVIVSDITNPAAATSSLTILSSSPSIDAGAYSCIAGTSDSGSTPSAAAMLSFHPLPAVAPSAMPTSACLGRPIQLTAHPSGGSPATPFVVWSVLSGPNTSTNQFLPFFVAHNPTFSATLAGTYVLQAQSFDPTCFFSATGSLAVQIQPVLDAGPSPTSATTCINGSVPLSANPTGGDGAYSYVWTVENQPPDAVPVFSPSNTDANPSFRANVVGDYSLAVQIAAPDCDPIVSDTIDINITKQINVSVSAGDTEFCLGSTTSLTASADGIAPTYSWVVQSGPNTASTQFSNPNSAMPVFIPTAVGDYDLAVTASTANCPAAMSTIQITVHPAVTANIAAVPAGTCLGQFSQLSVMTAGGGISSQIITWSVIAGPDLSVSQFSNSAIPNPVFTPSTVTTQAVPYRLRAEVVDLLCGVIIHDETTLIVDAAPAAMPTATPDTVCILSPTMLAAHATGNGMLTLNWMVVSQPPGSMVSFMPVPTAVNPTFSASVPGEYVVRVLVSGMNCPNVPSPAITVTVTPQTQVTASAFDPQICLGSSTLLIASAGGATGTTYAWTVLLGPNTSSTQFSNTGAATPIFTPAAAGQYVLRVAAMAPNCPGGFDTVDVMVPAAPVAIASALPTTSCVNNATQLSVQSGGSGTANQVFEWSIVSGPNTATSQFSNLFIHNPVFRPTHTTTATTPYKLKVQVVDLGCGEINDDEIDLFVNTALSAAPVATPVTGCLGVPTTLSAHAAGGDGTYTYNWTIASGPTDPPSQISNAQAAAPTFTPAVAPANYTLSLVVGDGFCQPAQPAYFVPIPVVERLMIEPEAGFMLGARGVPMPLHANVEGGSTTTFQWNVAARPPGCPSTNPFANATSANPTFTPNCTGDYTLTVAVDDNACPDLIDSLVVSVVEFVTTPTAAPAALCMNQSTVLSPNVTTGYEPYSFDWSITQGPNTSLTQLSNPESAAPTFSPTLLGIYTLRVMVTDDAELLPPIAGNVTMAVSAMAPTFAPTGQPVSQVVCEGESVEFNVAATGANVTYQWRRDDQDLPGATTSTLAIGAVSTADAGNYTCVIGNGCGSVTSNIATLTVDPPFTTTLLTVAKEDAKLRDAAIIGCTIAPVLSNHGDMGAAVNHAVGLAVHPTTGVAYVAVRPFPLGGSARTSIAIVTNPWTGQLTSVFDMGQPISDIAFHPNGTLYAVRGNSSCPPPQCAAAGQPGQMFTVNPADGALTPLSPPIVFGEFEGQSIAFDDQGRLYHHGLQPGVVSRLTRRTLANPTQFESLHTYGVGDEWTAMTIHPDGFLAVRRGSPGAVELWSIDPTTFDHAVLGPIDSGPTLRTPTGIAFIDLITGDFDLDDDVDLDDYVQFEVCRVAPTNPACLAFDFDRDGDVGLFDWGSFQTAFTGPP